ncbi:hypothetical protein NA57DRAFT_51072 [Rhizodiscina lignyota]|uniref:Uncharacterized protein n=1 Tax=Rhizodiscina lignyota TaxID=1504668 RepID=A0A9P4MB16_9PEZI|nr:hypothetical protein NA57DRAFT_51072 [Rhizodiscina lignyota]
MNKPEPQAMADYQITTNQIEDPNGIILQRFQVAGDDNAIPRKIQDIPNPRPEGVDEFLVKRSEKLFRILEFNWVICPLGLVACFLLAYRMLPLCRVMDVVDIWWTPDTLSCVLVGIFGFLSNYPPYPFSYALSVSCVLLFFVWGRGNLSVGFPEGDTKEEA